MGHIAIFGDDFETFDGFFVADYIGKVDGSILLNPVGCELGYFSICEGTNQGRS